MKKLKVPDINLLTAKLAIEIHSKPSTTQLVLAELINISNEGIITDISKYSSKISRKLNITPENYRYAIRQLNTLGLITKEYNNLILHPIAKKTNKIVIE